MRMGSGYGCYWEKEQATTSRFGFLVSLCGILNDWGAWISGTDSSLLSEGSQTGKAASEIGFSFPETPTKPITGEIAQRPGECLPLRAEKPGLRTSAGAGLI